MEVKSQLHIIGTVHPNMNIISVINYSPSCRSKPVRPSFIYGTQYFLMKSESFLTLHRHTLVNTGGRWHGREELLNKFVIFVFFAHKIILVAS